MRNLKICYKIKPRIQQLSWAILGRILRLLVGGVTRRCRSCAIDDESSFQGRKGVQEQDLQGQGSAELNKGLLLFRMRLYVTLRTVNVAKRKEI